jgi:putative sterol carrier protein
MTSRANDFFDTNFAKMAAENPACMVGAGVRGKTVSLLLDGKNGVQWTFNFDNEGKLAFAKGAPSKSDCEIAMKDETFEGLVAGKVNVPFAFMMRKIKVKGDVTVAANVGLALQKLFRS